MAPPAPTPTPTPPPTSPPPPWRRWHLRHKIHWLRNKEFHAQCICQGTGKLPWNRADTGWWISTVLALAVGGFAAWYLITNWNQL